MDLRLLEYMLRVAELGSINKAATDLQLSQPALSRYISALERDMGAKLFIRTQSGVALTEAGRLCADRARPLLRQLAMVKKEVGDAAAGQLSIGVPPSWQHVFTFIYVRKLATEYPGIRLRVQEGVSHSLRDSLMAGLLDLAIIPFDTAAPSGFIQTPLVREPLVIVGPPSEGFRCEEPVPLSRVSAAKLILPGRPNLLSTQVEHVLKRKGMEFRIAVETDTLALCLDLARQGFGLTIVPACALSSSEAQNGVSWGPLRGMYISWALFENKARSHSPAVREGGALVSKILAETLNTDRWFGAEKVGSGV